MLLNKPMTVISSSNGIRNSVNYNKQKVKKEVATCLATVNYLKDILESSLIL